MGVMAIPTQITSTMGRQVDSRDFLGAICVAGMTLAAEFFILRFFDFGSTRIR